MPRDRSHHKSPYREAADGGRRRCSIRHLNHVAFSLVMNVDDLVVAAAIECFAIAAPDRGLGALRSVPCGLDLASGPNPSLLNPFLRLFEQPRPTSRSMGSRTRWLGTRPSANVNPHATSRRWVGYTASSLAKGPYPHLSAAEGAFGAEGSWPAWLPSAGRDKGLSSGGVMRCKSCHMLTGLSGPREWLPESPSEHGSPGLSPGPKLSDLMS